MNRYPYSRTRTDEKSASKSDPAVYSADGRWKVDSRSIPLPPVDMSTLTTSSKPTLCMASSSLQHKTLACSTNANADANADADSHEIYHATARHVG
jgi:hypothetical protein